MEKEITRRAFLKNSAIALGAVAISDIGGKSQALAASQEKSQVHFTNNERSTCMKRPVTFKNKQINIAAEVHLPTGFDETGSYPAVVCAHPAGSVKEQSPSLYARMLADKGFLVLTFDASHQGASGGEPRFLEDPFERVEDVRCAVDYLSTLAFVDTTRIGAFGICAGAGYTISAAATERRIKAVAGVSATDAGAAIREGWEGKLPVSEQIKMLEAVAAQRTAQAKGAEPQFVPYVPETVDENTSVTMREAHDYYRTPRAQHPNSPNKAMFTGLDRLLAFSAADRIDTLLTQPLLLVVGSKSDARRYVDIFHEKAASNDKEVFVVEGATHVDLYDVTRYVDQAAAKLAAFFSKKL